MRFLSIYKTIERKTPPTPEEMASMGKLIEEGMKSGWLLSTEGCLPTSFGARVRRQEGKVSVIKAGAQWEVLGVNDLGDECFATPAIAGDRLYIRTRARLFCFANAQIRADGRR